MARVCDLPAVLETRPRQGRVRADRGGPRARGARAPAAAGDRGHLPGTGSPGTTSPGCSGASPPTASRWRPATWCPRRTLLAQLGTVPGLARLHASGSGIDEGAETPGLAAAAVEFAMEGLHLNRRLAKDVPPTAGRSTAAEPCPETGAGSATAPWHGGPDPLAAPFDLRGRRRRDRRPGPRRRHPARGPARAAAPRHPRAGRAGRPAAPGRASAAGRPASAAASTARWRRCASCSTEALAVERAALRVRRPTTTRALAETELDTLPDDTARAVRALRGLRLALAGGPRRPTSRSRTCCGGRSWTASSAG